MEAQNLISLSPLIISFLTLLGGAIAWIQAGRKRKTELESMATNAAKTANEAAILMIDQLQERVSYLEIHTKEQDRRLNDQSGRIADQAVIIAEQAERISALEKEVAEKTQTIAKLREENNRLKSPDMRID